LHLACVQGKARTVLETIQCLVHAWPESVCVHCIDHDDDDDADFRDAMRRTQLLQND